MTTNQQQNDETNNRIFTRNIPQQMLQPYLDIKPTSTTRCSVFPITDNRIPNAQVYPEYHPATTFNPGNRKAPWSGFSSRINDESILRNWLIIHRIPNNCFPLYLQRICRQLWLHQNPKTLLFLVIIRGSNWNK